MWGKYTELKWKGTWIRISGIVLVLLFVMMPIGATMAPEVVEKEKNITVIAEQDEDILPSLVSKDGFVLRGRLGEGSKEYTFLLDTGAEMCVLDNQIIKELALPQFLEDEIHDASGNMSNVKFYQTASLSVGKMTIHNLPILGLDIKFLKTIFDMPIDGIIGYNFLKYFAVTLDYQHNQVVLSLKNRLSPPQRAILGKVNKNDFKVTIPVTVDGIAFNPFIDTGAIGSSINVPNEILEKCKIKRSSKGGMSEGAFGSSEKNIIAKADITIGDYDFKDTIATSLETATVGHDFLSQCTVVLDYPKEKAWLVPNGKITLPKEEYSLGVEWELGRNDQQGVFVVNGVWEGSPADLAHLCKGDRIIAINDVKISEEPDAYWKKLLHNDTRFKLLVEKSQGVQEMVTLEKAYWLSAK